MKVILIRQKYKQNNVEDLLVIEQNIGAFDVSVQEILLVTVIKALQQLPHERLDVVLVEVDQARLEQSHQIVVHVFKNQIESTYSEQRTVQSTCVMLQYPKQWGKNLMYLCHSWSPEHPPCPWQSLSCWWCSYGWAVVKFWFPLWLWLGSPPSHCPDEPSSKPPSQL